MKRFNLYSFLILVLILSSLVFYKIVKVPITHDETATTVHYINFTTWEIMMYPDAWPNNHILNTLMVKALTPVFGKNQVVVRFPNFIFFIVYAFAVFRILRLVLKPDSFLFIPAALLFFANPYLLDFFGLCRGYGMSCALATLSVSYLISGFIRYQSGHILLSVFFSILASYANFTLLIFWLAVTGMALFYFYLKSDKMKDFVIALVFILILSLSYFALIATPLYKMQSTNQFQYWTSGGFFKETVIPLIEYSRYGSDLIFKPSSRFIAAIILITILLNCIYILRRFIKNGFKIKSLNTPVFTATAVLLLTAAASIVQSVILKTPNLHGRTALFFYPLFVISFVGTLSLISKLKNMSIPIGTAVFIGFFSIYHLTDRYNLQYVKEWWYDENNLEVLNYLKQKYEGDPIVLKTNWLFHPSMYFYSYTGKTPWLDLQGYDKETDLNTSAEYYYVFAEDYEILEPEFEVEHKFSADRWLLKRRKQ